MLISDAGSYEARYEYDRQEHTNITFPRISSVRSSRYRARTMPAGQSCPPQPSLRSSCRRRGGERRPEKERLVVPGVFAGREGRKSSEMWRARGGDVMLVVVL